MSRSLGDLTIISVMESHLDAGKYVQPMSKSRKVEAIFPPPPQVQHSRFLPLKNDAWKSILSFWFSAYCQGRAVKLPDVQWYFSKKHRQKAKHQLLITHHDSPEYVFGCMVVGNESLGWDPLEASKNAKFTQGMLETPTKKLGRKFTTQKMSEMVC